MANIKKDISIHDSALIKSKIITVRGVQVMLDSDLAAFYCVETKVLNQVVKRNINRFPEEFMFRLTSEEKNSLRFQIGTLNENGSLRSQIVTLEKGRGAHRKYLPYVFTEQGVAMLSAVLKSETAVKMSIQIMGAFAAMRRFVINNVQLFQKLETVE